MRRGIGWALACVQALLAVRVARRLALSGGDAPIRAAPVVGSRRGKLAIVIPVLNEAARLSACLEGALTQDAAVGEILVVDSGSIDGTPDLVRPFARRDARIRLLAAGPAPEDWNGKVWGLHMGERALDASVDWVLTLDADVRPAPALGRSLMARAASRRLRLLSVATAQHLAGAADGLVHPALLATLVYRFGRPGGVAHTPASVMANGQCFLIRRDLLNELGGFESVRDSLCEDITLARLAARSGEAVGFYGADDLIEVTMYAGWREVWANWPRSLVTRDALFGVSGWIGLLEVLLVQALPLPLLLVGHARRLNAALFAVRVGMLVGMASAYPERPPTYWLSPLMDLPAALALWWAGVARRHTWRGRIYVRR